MSWNFVLADSLETVRPTVEPRPINRDISRSVFLAETYSFQLAFRPPATARRTSDAIKITVAGAAAEHTTLYAVDLVPATLPAFPDHDDNYLFDSPGLYPDPLVVSTDGLVEPLVGHWRSVWFDVRVDELPRSVTDAADLDLRLTVQHAGSDEQLYRDELTVTVINQRLPALDIVNTQWLHADCLLDYYGGSAFDDDHWRAIDSFVGSAARMGINGLLTPIWTPPLDTAVGTRRTPVQLVGISRRGEDYTFDFTDLERWLEILARHGIEYVELAHLFTQWGARATPAIDAEVDGELRQIFGWDVRATDPSYRHFLEQFIPALQQLLTDRWDPAKVIYHISDEPSRDHLDDYRAARAVVEDLLVGCLIADALSDYDFYTQGVVKQPIVATNHAEPFLAGGVRRPWLYYCVSQNKIVANRFIAMPPARHRVIGQQLFAADAGGFLHWGFNFYNSQHSRSAVNPYADTCADNAFPAGDPFIVYPGPDRQVRESTRHRVAAQAINDHRALQLVRDQLGRAAALELIDPDRTLSLTEYPTDADHYLATRERINEAVRRR
ncbi:DUF4091 domain-containing protein [Microlunatus soli]|uniref:Glycoside hydrolase 123 catalytic domain-containing protein n=1 Tax=Microlunatus soli TaxID=630515 RepID=A0A1H1Y6T8_9ACTN|nr:DUF4091 domain-containing protein [Microlunatus soli]SDT17147.1 protein of unknown function [Microlunatus soli]